MRKILKTWFWVIILWSIYRYIFVMPEWFDEFIVKPIFFILVPLNILRFKHIPGFEKRKNVFDDIIIGISAGFFMAITAVVANKVKYGDLSFAPVIPVIGGGIILYIIISLATGISEEILGRGFIFKLFSHKYSIFLSAFFSSVFSVSIHIPVLLMRLNFQGITLIIYLISIFLLSMVNSYLYAQRKSLVLPILIHAFWNMAVALYI